MGDEAYELIVNKNSVVIIGQGGSTWVDYISRKNGVSTPVTFSKDSDWIRLTIDTFAHNFTISVDKNDTGVARNGTVTITQDESGKKAYVYVQQQATAPDNEYEWVLNDSEILAEIELFKKSISGEENYWVFDYLKDWTPSNPYLIVPTEPCTYEDYISGRKLMYNTYTVTIYYHSSVRSSAIRYPTVDVNIWFDAKIKS
ncbi:MAG: hypothetical protein LBK58_10325 [Prevotellaceae bacterium]|jgi:hypothetical protein|nr:hypothetical protein [Prevotellaceae bacterium]